MTQSLPSDSAAQAISVRGMGSGARATQRPGAPAGAGLSTTRWASWAGVSTTGPGPRSGAMRSDGMGIP